jgi:hypothetical protein
VEPEQLTLARLLSSPPDIDGTRSLASCVLVYKSLCVLFSFFFLSAIVLSRTRYVWLIDLCFIVREQPTSLIYSWRRLCLQTIRSVWRYQRGNQNPLIEDGQATQYDDLVSRYGTSILQITTDMFICRKYVPVHSSFMTYHWICIYRNTMGTTSGAGTSYSFGAHELIPGS